MTLFWFYIATVGGAADTVIYQLLSPFKAGLGALYGPLIQYLHPALVHLQYVMGTVNLKPSRCEQYLEFKLHLHRRLKVPSCLTSKKNYILHRQI